MADDILFAFEVEKRAVDPDERLVYGWMSVTWDNGAPVIDTDGDIILTENLKDVVHKYIDTSRVAATDHTRDDNGDPVRTGRIQDSLVVTADVAKALGMSGDREGWYVSIRIEDDATWKGIQEGTLRAFSIGARGRRLALDE